MIIIFLLKICLTSQPSFWPLPKIYHLGTQTNIDPCTVTIRVSTKPIHLKQIVNYFRIKALKCNTTAPSQY